MIERVGATHGVRDTRAVVTFGTVEGRLNGCLIGHSGLRHDRILHR